MARIIYILWCGSQKFVKVLHACLFKKKRMWGFDVGWTLGNT